ncbi:glycosyl transferase family 1 [Bacillus pseudomycoides]|uniref:Glycosyl transferase family 1 n=2 Tax=Bacillaceae TaxID=186817 RepID=A0AAJ3RC99_9BACI|nr:Glycosyl transferase, group 1 [Bacillus pseudomycoides]MBJ8026444.1 glycosyltransferase [Bacillus cereus group sp. N21]EEM08677.1 Glycosyl transferase, group 1 [Bacillus pseudomycoides]MBD5796778.1 glycosyl transferase family 1 [Bacillus pseudomycoides]MDR4189961.1 glycosyltransferase family 4 protein [Bacillus pseudomycoides]
MHMNQAKKVCIVSPIHDYKDIRVYQKQAKTIENSGYEVSLLARKDYDEKIGNIQIFAIPKSKNFLSRIILQPKLLCKILKTRSKIVHLHNPDTILLGFLLKMFNKKVIYDTHEDFSKRILIREWIPYSYRKLIAKVVTGLELMASRCFDGFIVTQEGLLAKYKNALLIENAPIHQGELITRAYELSKLISKSNYIRVVYVGGISEQRGLRQIVQALEEINKTYSCRLWLIGPDSKEINELQKLNGWKYVDYLGKLPQEKAFSYVIKSDIGLCTILDVVDHAETSPNKIFEYMTLGIPFIASDFPKWEKKIGCSNAGYFVDPQNINKIADLILKIGSDENLKSYLSNNGKKYIYEKFNWERESEKLIEYYKKIN